MAGFSNFSFTIVEPMFSWGRIIEIPICDADQSRVYLVEAGGEAQKTAHLSACSYLHIAQFLVAQKMHDGNSFVKPLIPHSMLIIM